MEKDKAISSKARPGLKALRKSAKLTQRDLAIRLDVHDKAVAAWENQGAVPSFDKAVLLAKELKVSLRKLAAEFGMDVEGVPEEEEEPMIN